MGVSVGERLGAGNEPGRVGFMVSRLPVTFLLLGLLWGGAAHAQFANRSIGLSLGYLDLNNAESVENGIPLGLNASLYIENGFDLTLNFQVMLLREKISERQVIGIAPATGIRYLFSEENVRPYLGADLSFLYIFGIATTQGFVGLGPNAGIDIFLSDNVSIGAKGIFNVYVSLNAPVQTSLGATANIATYF